MAFAFQYEMPWMYDLHNEEVFLTVLRYHDEVFDEVVVTTFLVELSLLIEEVD